MIKVLTTVLMAGLLAPLAVAQQTPQPQPQNPQTIAAPCASTTQPQSPNKATKVASHIHFNPFAGKGGVALGKKLAEITQKTGISLTPPTSVPKPALPKPCPVAPTVASPQTNPIAMQNPQTETKTLLLCPPGTANLPNLPFCLKPDNTLIDAIKVTVPPPSKPNPQGPPAAQAAQH